jgi:hypothetical protein
MKQKQHITLEQYTQLPEKQQLYFLAQMEERGYSHLATIGQLIEFLDEQLFSDRLQEYLKRASTEGKSVWVIITPKGKYMSEQLIDAAWDAVKPVLTKRAR